MNLADLRLSDDVFLSTTALIVVVVVVAVLALWHWKPWRGH